jgi:hypothetical protein
MSDESNLPVMPGPPEPFYRTWMNVLTRPTEQTFAEMAVSPDAAPGKAYLWVFLAGMISAFISAVVQGVFLADQETTLAANFLIAMFCCIPVLGGLSVLGLMINAGLVQLAAGMFKGVGTYDQLAYVFGAISVPVTLIGSVLSVFYAVPFLAFCLWPLSLLLFLYFLVLEVIAVKGVNRFGWGEAVGSVLVLPLALIFCACASIGLIMVMGLSVGDIFSQINQSLQSIP